MYFTTAILISVKPCPYCPLSNFGEFPIPREPSRVIGNVRTMISCMYDISADNVHLEYGGKKLHNTDTLEEHDIKHGSVISVCTGGVSPRYDCEAPLDEASRRPEANDQKISMPPDLVEHHKPLHVGRRTCTERIDVFYKMLSGGIGTPLRGEEHATNLRTNGPGNSS